MMEPVWSIRRDPQGFAVAIEENGHTVIHLYVGTVRNEDNIERIVELLNSSATNLCGDCDTAET